MLSSEGLNWADLGETSPSFWAPRQDAILQPAKPQITPSATILHLTAGRDAGHEAAD
jgi:hypothetical protein